MHLFADPAYRVRPDVEAGRRYLGLSGAEALALFCPKGLDATRSYPRITPEQAAIACRRLAHRIEGGIDSYMESEILTRALWSPA